MKLPLIFFIYVSLLSCRSDRIEDPPKEGKSAGGDSVESIFELFDRDVSETEFYQESNFDEMEVFEREGFLVSVIGQFLWNSVLSEKNYPITFGYIKSLYPEIFARLLDDKQQISGRDFLGEVLVK